MANTVQIIGMEKLLQNLSKKQLKALKDSGAEARVGYTANYALFVHEKEGMKWKGKKRTPNPPHKGRYWDPQGRTQPKYLEEPTRELLNDGTLSKIITTAYKNGAPLETSLFLAALRIQRESQQRVPVDTGNLKASAFTRKGKS